MIGEAQYAADIIDHATGQFYMATDSAVAREVAAFANQHWRADVSGVVELRLSAMDQQERDICRMDPRTNAEEARAHLALWTAERDAVREAERAHAESARTHIDNTVSDPAASPLPGERDSGVMRPSEGPAIGGAKAAPPASAPDDQLLQKHDDFVSAGALRTEMQQIQTRTALAQADIALLSETRDTHVLAKRRLENRLSELYGDAVPRVLADLSTRFRLQERGEAISAMRRDPAQIGALDRKWHNHSAHPALARALQTAGLAAADAFIAERKASRSYQDAQIEVAARNEVPASASPDRLREILEARVADGTQAMQRMHGEIARVHLPTLARDIRKHYLSLSEAERTSFLSANPQFRSVLAAGNTIMRAADGLDRGGSGGRER